MTLISEHIETDTRERILVVAERLFRQIGYQKTTVADIAKELRMSPANVYRFFDSKKSIHEGVARGLMGGVETGRADHRHAARSGGGPPARTDEHSIHHMNSERYVGDSKMHEMVAIAMEEDWDVCVAHMELITETIGSVIAQGRGVRRVRGHGRAARGDVRLHRHDPVLPPPDDRPMRQQAGADDRRNDRLYHRRPLAACQDGKSLVPSLRA